VGHGRDGGGDDGGVDLLHGEGIATVIRNDQA